MGCRYSSAAAHGNAGGPEETRWQTRPGGTVLALVSRGTVAQALGD